MREVFLMGRYNILFKIYGNKKKHIMEVNDFSDLPTVREIQ